MNKQFCCDKGSCNIARHDPPQVTIGRSISYAKLISESDISRIANNLYSELVN